MKYKVITGIMLTVLLLSVLKLAFDIQPISAKPVFFDDFSDELWTEQHWTAQFGNWQVMNGEYFIQAPQNPESYALVDNLNFTYCVMEAQLRFIDTAEGLLAWIHFRHANGRYYRFYANEQYDEIGFTNYTRYIDFVSYTIVPNVNYTLKVEVAGYTFKGFVNGEEVLSVTDSNNISSIGQVGLGARKADVFFDNFIVWSSPPVGGVYLPVNKLELLTPYIGLTILLAVAVVTVGYVKKRKSARMQTKDNAI